MTSKNATIYFFAPETCGSDKWVVYTRERTIRGGMSYEKALELVLKLQGD